MLILVRIYIWECIGNIIGNLLGLRSLRIHVGRMLYSHFTVYTFDRYCPYRCLIVVTFTRVD